jgi:hypothetical protein
MNKKRTLFNVKGQATTEIVLLLPLFLIFILFMIRIFGLLVMMQKLEIAAVYAAKRWQQEAHATPEYAFGWDMNFLKKDIEKRVGDYIGVNNAAVRSSTGLQTFSMEIDRSEDFWDKLVFEAYTRPPKLGVLCKYDKLEICSKERIMAACLRGYDYICESGGTLQVTKYVHIRQRPVQFEIPTGGGSSDKKPE